MSEIHDVVGYVVCVTCEDELVLDVIAGRTGGRCPACFAERGKFDTIEIEARGARLPIPVRAKRSSSKPKRRSPESVARRKLADKCRERARKRLQAIFPDLYDILLAEERAAVGLDPFPLDVAVRGREDPDGSQTAEFAAVYHALDEHGVRE